VRVLRLVRQMRVLVGWVKNKKNKKRDNTGTNINASNRMENVKIE